MPTAFTEHAPMYEALGEAAFGKVLAGKTALVTGGSRGIGKATAMALAEAGAAVAVNYQYSVEAADEVCRAIGRFGVQANTYQANVSCEDEAKAMVDAVTKDFGPIDILVNNAGITRDKSFLKMTKIMWDEVLGVNLNGVFHITRLVLPGMVEAGWGRIVNMTSIVGQTGNFGQANYAVSKGGLIAFTMTLAREVARKGVTVNAVAPGFIETDMTKDMTAAALLAVTSMTPLGRLGKPEEVAAAVRSWPRPRPAISPARSSQSTAACICNRSPCRSQSFSGRLPAEGPRPETNTQFFLLLRRSRKMIRAANNKSGDLFQQAMESFETALRAGMKLQEESVQRCVEILRDVGSPLEWERTVPAKVTKAITAMQQNVDQSIRFMNENAQQTVNLMEMALQMHRRGPRAVR